MHKTRCIRIKEADIDVKIIPVVEWLNSHDDIYTRWSCQGATIKPPKIVKNMASFTLNDKPYVVFHCDSTLSLIAVTDRIRGYGLVEVEFYEPAGCLRYILKLYGSKGLERFTQSLNKWAKSVVA